MTPSLLRAVDRFASKRVLVLGDAMLDSYVVGSSTRLCQEAPAPVIAVHDRREYPGGAANTALNLAALGCQVDLISVVGADYEGDRLLALLRGHGVGTRLVTVSEARRTLAKQRIVNGDQLLARLDHGDTGPVPRHVERRLREQLETAFVRADAVVISDYGYGVVTAGLLGHLRAFQEQFRQLVAVDARDLPRYRPIGVTVVKPNFAEALRLAGQGHAPGDRSRIDLAGLAAAVLDRTGASIAAITLDSEGAIVVERGQPLCRTLSAPAQQAHTSGAGDTYLATLALALAAGATTREAAEVAACAAGVVVQQDGTTACTVNDLRRALATLRFVEEEDGRDGPADLGPRRAPALHQA